MCMYIIMYAHDELNMTMPTALSASTLSSPVTTTTTSRIWLAKRPTMSTTPTTPHVSPLLLMRTSAKTISPPPKIAVF